METKIMVAVRLIKNCPLLKAYGLDVETLHPVGERMYEGFLLALLHAFVRPLEKTVSKQMNMVL